MSLGRAIARIYINIMFTKEKSCKIDDNRIY